MSNSLPDTYDELIADIMAKQDKKKPAYKTEAACRAEMAKWYPGLEERYDEMKVILRLKNLF